MNNKKIAQDLQVVLADTFALYFKTHSFHWNVTGAHFRSLHMMFEEQYTEMWKATDEIAERIRTLGEWAPNNMQELQKNASEISETGQLPDAPAMVEQLANDNRAIVKTLYKALRTAEDEGDEATVDMMVERVQAHEQAAWMLESSMPKAA